MALELDTLLSTGPVRRVGLLVFPGFELLDIAGPLAVFRAAIRRGARYETCVLAGTPGRVESCAGASVVTADLLAQADLDTLLVAGGEGAGYITGADRLMQYLWFKINRVRRVAAAGAGGYILGKAALLEGRRATTHWSRAVHFASQFRRTEVDPDCILVRDGNIWTAAGATAAVDLSLAFVEEDFGRELAQWIAGQLLVSNPRAGLQSQYAVILEQGPISVRIMGLMRWIRDHLAEDLRVPRLAERIGMSPRHLARAFLADTGITPARAVERLRLEAARSHVRSGRLPIEAIAKLTGFSAADTLRSAYRRAYGCPLRYRGSPP